MHHSRLLIPAALIASLIAPIAVGLSPTELVFEEHARIAWIDGMKSAFRPGERVSLTIKALEKDGTMAAPNRGWNIQWNTYYGPPPNPRTNLDSVGGDAMGGNAAYANGQWTVAYTLPTEPGRYFIGVSLYCSQHALDCGTKTYFQLDRDLEFWIDATASATTKRIEFSQNATPTTCSDTDGGKDLLRKGSVQVTGNPQLPYLFTDFCTAEELTEYSCASGKAAQSTIACPNGCSDGVCVNEKARGTPRIAKIWLTPDTTCTAQECRSYHMWIDVRKADGTPLTEADAQGRVEAWISNWFSATKKYSSPGRLATWTAPENGGRTYFHMGYGASINSSPQSERFLVRVRQGKQSVRKKFTVTVMPNGKVVVK